MTLFKGFFKGLLKVKQEENKKEEEIIKEETIEERKEIHKEKEKVIIEERIEDIVKIKETANSEATVEQIKEVEIEKNIELVEEKIEIKTDVITVKDDEKEEKQIETNYEPIVEQEIKAEIIEEEPKTEEITVKKGGFFASLKDKLKKTRDEFFGKLKRTILGRTIIDEEMYEELEEILIQSDIGYDMTIKIVNSLQKKVKEKNITKPEEVYVELKEVMKEFLISEGNGIEIHEGKLNIILIVGVNGVGKTTTIGKMASKFVKDGKHVVIGAGDTFRAAAIEQLEEWGKRSEVEVIKHSQGADPGAVVFDTIKAAKSRKADIAIIDTAGRLHNKGYLMAELAKINKIIAREIGENEKYEAILVLDGTTGQNGINQAKVFNEVTKLTGFVITKLDGTAKGGIVFAVSDILKQPIKYIGVGEGIEDLKEFSPQEFIEAIFD
jgi:fused signal recognition particle receptor